MSAPFKKHVCPEILKHIDIENHKHVMFQKLETEKFTIGNELDHEEHQTFNVLAGWYVAIDADYSVNMFSSKPFFLSETGKWFPKKPTVRCYNLGRIQFHHKPECFTVPNTHAESVKSCLTAKHIITESILSMGVEEKVWIPTTDYWVSRINGYLSKEFPEKIFRHVPKSSSMFSQCFERIK